MFRLRNAVAAFALASSGVGCATFCDECDDFPIPGRYAALPGSYTGPPLEAEPRSAGSSAPLSPTATRESGTTPAPASGDDSAGGDASATPPPPVPSNPAPFSPPAGDTSLPQLP